MVDIRHGYQSGIADSPAAAAAGQVLPSHWNADHQVLVTAADVLLGNTGTPNSAVQEIACTAFARSVLDDANAAAALATLGAQPLDSDLTAIAALTTTAYGRALLALADSAALLALILTVDGSGSGLDADTLDGHDTAYFQTALGYTAENVANKDTDGTLAANSDTKYASQKATKTYVDQIIAAQDAMVFKGVIDCSANPNYPVADRGHTYRVSVAGKIGGASGTNVEAGDLLLCLTDGTSAGDQATVGASWSIAQTNLDGAVIGPASAVSGQLASYSGTSGKLIQDSGLALDTDGALAANSDAKLASQKAVKTYVAANSGGLTGFRNRLINGGMRIWQRGIGSVADDVYGFDRWNNLVQTAATTISQLTNVEDTTPDMMRITQGQASAQRFGTSQIIESVNCRDLRGQVVTLSARVRCSNSMTLRYAVLEWTGTADAVTSDVVNDWTNGTFAAGQFFNSTTLTVTATGSTALTANTLATVFLTTTLGSSVNNVIVVFWTDSTQAQNSTLDIGKVQFEASAAATAFERVPFAVELEVCQRYFEKSANMATAIGSASDQSFVFIVTTTSVANGGYYGIIYFKANKRVAPTVTTYPYTTPSNTFRSSNNVGTDYAANSAAIAQAGETNFSVYNNSGSALTIGANIVIFSWYADAEL